MRRQTSYSSFTAPGILLLAIPLAATPLIGDRDPVEFDEARLVFELNETDGDAEVVFLIKGPDGLKELEVEGPDGSEVFELDVEGRAERKVGLKQFVIESGEPNIVDILATFPEGRYEVEGVTLDGQDVEGSMYLSHDLAPAPAYAPADGAVVAAGGLVVEWAPVMGAHSYILELEQDDLGFNLTATLPAEHTSFSVPAGVLAPGTEYDLGLSTVSFNGNVSVAESSFSTAR